jgi:GAF domain-containing protein
MTLADRRRGVIEAIDRAVSSGATTEEVARRAVELLHERFAGYTWVGIYLSEGDELVLAAWAGPEEGGRQRIAVGTGICGVAAQSGRAIVIDDATAEEYFRPVFRWTRSEIAVPLERAGRVLGAIAIESDEVAKFGPRDQAFVERVARMLSTMPEA